MARCCVNDCFVPIAFSIILFTVSVLTVWGRGRQLSKEEIEKKPRRKEKTRKNKKKTRRKQEKKKHKKHTKKYRTICSTASRTPDDCECLSTTTTSLQRCPLALFCLICGARCGGYLLHIFVCGGAMRRFPLAHFCLWGNDAEVSSFTFLFDLRGDAEVSSCTF